MEVVVVERLLARDAPGRVVRQEPEGEGKCQHIWRNETKKYNISTVGNLWWNKSKLWRNVTKKKWGVASETAPKKYEVVSGSGICEKKKSKTVAKYEDEYREPEEKNIKGND